MYQSFHNHFIMPAVLNSYPMSSHSLYYSDFNALPFFGSGPVLTNFEGNTRNYISIPVHYRRESYGYGINEKTKKYLNLNRFSTMKRRVCKDNDESTSKDRHQPPPKRPYYSPSSPPKIKYHLNEYGSLSQEIVRKHHSMKQSNIVYDKKMRLCCELQVVLTRRYSECFLYVVGSSINGFGSNTSDMDVCFYLSKNDMDQRIEALNHLRNVRKELKNYDYIQKLELITAKVPILKFRDKVSGVEVDLNVNNSVGVRNTHLLHHYSKVDNRVRPLVGIIKLWARIQDINDAKCMTISSYSLTLMVIHYLQCGVSPPVLPSLQKLHPNKFDPCVDIHTLRIEDDLTCYHSENHMCLGELLIGFMDYFTNHFDFAADAMSIRTGTKLPKHYVQNQKSKKNNPGQWKCLNIEEPFDLTNTARSVYDDVVFSRVKSVFRSSWMRLRETKQLGSILHY